METLTKIWVRDPELGVAVAQMPFYAGSVTYNDYHALAVLDVIAEADRDLALAMTGFAWFADGLPDERGPSPTELLAIEFLAMIAEASPGLAGTLQGNGWFADTPTVDEGWLLGSLARFAEKHPDLAAETAGAPWLAASSGGYERSAIEHLHVLADWNPKLARRMLVYVSEEPFRSRNFSVLSALSIMSSRDLDIAPLERLVAQPWFADGLDAEERALITGLTFAAQQADDLMNSPFSRSAVITLPIAGEVNLWAFRPDPFLPDNLPGSNVLAMMEEAVRGAERLTGLPFPTTDVILVILDPASLQYPGQFLTDHILIAHHQRGRVFDSNVFHEIGHYYFNKGPRWLVEGGAELVGAYVKARLIHRYRESIAQLPSGAPLPDSHFSFLPPFPYPKDYGTLEYQVREMGEFLHAPNGCVTVGLENVHALSNPDPPPGANVFLCTYAWGRYLLGRLLLLFGEEAFSLALQELHLPSLEAHGPTEEEIYGIFLKHAPPGLEQEFRDVYKRIHGGPFLDGS